MPPQESSLPSTTKPVPTPGDSWQHPSPSHSMSQKLGGMKDLEDDPKKSVSPVKDGAGFFVLFCTLVAALGPFAFGYSLGYTSPTLDSMAVEMGLSLGAQSVFSAIINVGAMIGAVTGGHLADQFGRKATLVVAAVPYLLGWGFISFGQEILQLCTGRLLTGFGTGVVSFAVPVYIAEIAPGQLRGSLGAVNQLAITIGILTVYTFGVICDWRSLAFIGVYPPALLLLGLLVIPESPRWLAKRGTPEELRQTLYRLRGEHADIESELCEIRAGIEESQSQPKATLADLGNPDLRRPLLVGVGLMVLQQFSGVNAVTFYAGPVFQAVGYADSNMPGIILQAVQVLATAVSTGLMDKAGRRPLLMVSAFFMGVGVFTLGLSFQLAAWPSLTNVSQILALVSLLLYIVAYSLGLGAIPWIIMSEIFPVHVRDLAGSLAVLTNWLSCFIVTLTFEDLLTWSSVGSFWLYAGICFFTVVFVGVLVPETRGRSLEEIEASFKHPIAPQLA